MKVIEKILFLQSKANLSDKEFSKKFGIKNSHLKEWKNETKVPNKCDITNICDYYKLDANDFMDETSSLDFNDLKKGEHSCKPKARVETPNDVYDDFAREENARYEERD